MASGQWLERQWLERVCCLCMQPLQPFMKLLLLEIGSRSGPLVGVTPVRAGVETIFRSKNKARYVRVHAATRDLEDDPSGKPPAKSTGTVLPYVVVACLGAILFGYHLGVVNGALEYLSRDLGISENTVLQGWVVSISLAGATIGSFTGGALADKFGRTRTLCSINNVIQDSFLACLPKDTF